MKKKLFSLIFLAGLFTCAANAQSVEKSATKPESKEKIAHDKAAKENVAPKSNEGKSDKKADKNEPAPRSENASPAASSASDKKTEAKPAKAPNQGKAKANADTPGVETAPIPANNKKTEK